MAKPSRYSEEQIAWLRDNRAQYVGADLAEAFNRRFGTAYKFDQLNVLCKRLKIRSGGDGRFKKGDPRSYKGVKGEHFFTATEFKQGHRPHNAVPVGTRIKTSDDYWKIKVAEPNKWQFCHVWSWEQAHGPRPKNHAVLFIDGDNDNLALENLVLVTRGELSVLNNKRLRSYPDELKPAVVGLVKLECAIRRIEGSANA